MLNYNRNLKPYSQTLRKEMTKAEVHLWMCLKGKQICGLPFYRQKIIGNYIVDFFCAKANLAIEVDGGQHYSEAGVARDEKRDNYLKEQGLQVLRFTDREVFANLEGVLERIMEQVNGKGGE
jgi:very-short-patch-repair endonuclease